MIFVSAVAGVKNAFETNSLLKKQRLQGKLLPPFIPFRKISLSAKLVYLLDVKKSINLMMSISLFFACPLPARAFNNAFTFAKAMVDRQDKLRYERSESPSISSG